jgi:hypothetical protein
MSITVWPEDRASRVQIRVYGGGSEAEIIATYHADAESLLTQGYEPVATHYIPGTYPRWYITAAVLSMLIIVGIFLVFMMLLNPRPNGALVVTYIRRGF